ncbi:MAG TPA: ABC transporter permease [Thermoanaerobaculaceae bacterium]|nr:ABC transporter permease [Thermoanaerobaculaceae bacterium]
MREIPLLAWRHLASRPRQSALTVAGVALGVAVFVFTVSMMDGLTVFFTQRLIRVSPLLTVLPERLDVNVVRDQLRRADPAAIVAVERPPVPDDRPTVRGATALAVRLRSVPGVLGVSVAGATPVVLSFGTVAEPATLVGLDPDDEALVTELPRCVAQGRWDLLASRRSGAVLGKDLADRLGVEAGDRVAAVGNAGQARELEVVGIIATGLGSLDESNVYVNLPVAQGVAGWGGDEGTEVRLRTAAVANLDGLRRRLEAITGHRVETWEEASQASLRLFRMIGITTYLLTGFVLVVAGLGIANKLTTIILDKERDIAILRSFGFSRGAVREVFLIEGVALGLVGAALGCAAAAAVIEYFTVFPIRFAPREGAVLAYTELFLAKDPRYYLVISVAALAISAVAALAAVRRAVRVVPVEVLRGAA